MGRSRIEIDVQECIKRYKAGESTRKMSEELGVCNATVQDRLRAAGVLRKGSGPAPVDVDPALVLRLYESGMKIADIRKKIKRSSTIIYNILEKSGISLRRGRYKQSDGTQCLYYYKRNRFGLVTKIFREYY